MSDKKYYLDINPDIIKLLGPNLYTNIYYVLGEIIANAYDADADNVYIIYNNNENHIVVEDDGNGMTYDDLNNKFLKIGASTRIGTIGDISPKYGRKRMGRKGIGKLSALSVSDKVSVMSVKNGIKSGCVLSLNANKEADNRWSIPGIDEHQIKFKCINEKQSGSSIDMEDVKYSIHKTMESAKRNISRIFPFVSQNFKIHLFNEVSGETVTIKDAIPEIIKLSDSLITFTDTTNPSELDRKLQSLHNTFDNDRYYGDKNIQEKKTFHLSKDILAKELHLKTINGDEQNFKLAIRGWISTYANLPRNNRDSDFPSSYISIISNGKLGRINILPEIGTNRTFENYVIGQFFVDLLDDSRLPDIAASNRQGYKEDDERYVETLALIKDYALKPVLNLKENATNVKKASKKNEEEKARKKNIEKMNEAIKSVVTDPLIVKAVQTDEDTSRLEKKLQNAMELKQKVKETYKKVMISHSSQDKEIVDLLEDLLLFCGFESKEILYTASSNYESRPAPYENIYEYLRKFFVDTIIRNDLCVVYVTSENFTTGWNTTLEAGAGWVVKSDHFPLYIDNYSSVKPPLNNNILIPHIDIGMNIKDVQNLARALQTICEKCKKTIPDYDKLLTYICNTPLYSENV